MRTCDGDVELLFLDEAIAQNSESMLAIDITNLKRLYEYDCDGNDDDFF